LISVYQGSKLFFGANSSPFGVGKGEALYCCRLFSCICLVAHMYTAKIAISIPIHITHRQAMYASSSQAITNFCPALVLGLRVSVSPIQPVWRVSENTSLMRTYVLMHTCEYRPLHGFSGLWTPGVSPYTKNLSQRRGGTDPVCVFSLRIPSPLPLQGFPGVGRTPKRRNSLGIFWATSHG
jgi:hypothetical protein